MTGNNKNIQKGDVIQMRNRDIQIKFRMNEEEYQSLQKKIKESGQTQQSFIVNALAGAMIAPKEEIDVLKNLNIKFAEIIRQVKGMATNVNQMAHVANGIGSLPTEYRLRNLAETIEQFRKECEKVWQSIRQLISQQNHMGQLETALNMCCVKIKSQNNWCLYLVHLNQTRLDMIQFIKLFWMRRNCGIRILVECITTMSFPGIRMKTLLCRKPLSLERPLQKNGSRDFRHW